MPEGDSPILFDEALRDSLRVVYDRSEASVCLACGPLLLNDRSEVRTLAKDVLFSVLSWRSQCRRIDAEVKSVVADYIFHSTVQRYERCFLLTACGSDDLIHNFDTIKGPASTKVRILGHSPLEAARIKLAELFNDDSLSNNARYMAALLSMRSDNAGAEAYVRRHAIADDVATEIAFSRLGDRVAANSLKSRLEQVGDTMWAEVVRRQSDLFADYDGLYRDDWRQRLVEQLPV